MPELNVLASIVGTTIVEWFYASTAVKGCSRELETRGRPWLVRAWVWIQFVVIFTDCRINWRTPAEIVKLGKIDESIQKSHKTLPTR